LIKQYPPIYSNKLQGGQKILLKRWHSKGKRQQGDLTLGVHYATTIY
jgi:hypothetical protein